MSNTAQTTSAFAAFFAHFSAYLAAMLHWIAAQAVAHPNVTCMIVLYLLTALANGLTSYGHSKSPIVAIIGKIVDVLSPFTRRNADGTFKLPLTRSTLQGQAYLVFSKLFGDSAVSDNSSGNRQSGRISLNLQFDLALFTLAVSALGAAVILVGCCWNKNAPQYATPQCVVARQSVDCGTNAAKGEEGTGVAIAERYIDSGTFDTPSLITALENLGYHFGGCILNAVANDFIKPGANMMGLPPQIRENRKQFLAGHSAWMAARK